MLTPGIETCAGFVAADKQPITTAKFSEPGFYDTQDPVKFDLRWLESPVKVVRRSVKGVAQPVEMVELEIVYANGNRLLFGDEGLAGLPARTEPPAKDAEVLRATFGISTPDIYASRAERAAEFEKPRAGYLMLLDRKGRHVDNHSAGVDRVFAWLEAGSPERLHLLLVGYERIAVVSSLSLPW